MTRAQARSVLWAPLGVWAALLALLGLSLVAAHLGLPFTPTASLLIGAIQGLLIAVLLMQLRRAVVLVRLTAAAGLAWISLLYLFTFADYLTR